MNIRKLPMELKEKAQKDFGENDKLITEHLEYITEWLKKQPHINANMDPQWLIAFLRGCKYSLQKTKERIDLLYTIRTHVQFLHNRDPADPKIQKILDLGISFPLPLTDQLDSPRVALMRPAFYNPKEITLPEILRIGCMVLDLLLVIDDRLTVSGVDVVVDLVGVKLEHLGQATPTVIKQCITCFQDAYPLKIKSIHVINPLPIMETVFALIKQFMSKKMRDRLMIHTDINDLFKYIPQRLLPVEYGGEAPSVAYLTKEWKSKITENRNWYLKDAQYGVIESKRPGKQMTNMDLFGADGSFKKLELD